MTLANPLALLWGLAAVAVVLLYVRRMRLRRVEVATSRFWNQVFAENCTLQAWHRWRHGVSLAVHLVILLLLVLALAEPLVPGPRSLVIVVDNSASMNAPEGETTRLELAKQAASRAAAGVRHCDRAAVFSAGDAVGVRLGMGNHYDRLLQAIAKVPATQGASRVADAVKIARAMLGGAENRRVLVFSDAAFDGAAELAGAGDVELVRVGTPIGNLALTGLEVRRSPVDPAEAQVLASAASFADEPLEAELAIFHNDRPLAAEPIRLDADGRWLQVFALTTTEAGRLTARLESFDTPSAADRSSGYVPLPDDELTAELPPATEHRVMLLGRESRFLRSALLANPRVALVNEDRPASGGAGMPIRVFVGETSQPLPAGPAIVIAPTSSNDLWQVGEPLADTIVAREHPGSDELADVSLAGMGIPNARSLELIDPARRSASVLLSNAVGEPLSYALDRSEGRVVVFAGDLDSGRLPYSSAMPVLLAGLVDWVAGPDEPFAAKQHAAALDRPAEFDLRVPTDVGTEVGQALFPAAGVPPWLVLVLLAVVLFVLEWCLYQRRWLT